MGLGSTLDSGCHLLAFPPEVGVSFGGTFGELSYMLISSVSSLNPTLLPLPGAGDPDGGGR